MICDQGELKQKKIEEDIEELIKRLDHLLSFTNLLKTELKSEQNKVETPLKMFHKNHVFVSEQTS